MAELLMQLQDQLDALSRKFYECVGILQRDAPPVAVSSEPLLAAPPAPGFDLQEAVQRMANEIREQCQVTEQLIQLLPEGLGSTQQPSDRGGLLAAAAGAAAAAAAAGGASSAGGQDGFDQQVRQLQQEHQQVSGELAAAVEEAEVLLAALQQLHAQLAQAKLKARAQQQQR